MFQGHEILQWLFLNIVNDGRILRAVEPIAGRRYSPAAPCRGGMEVGMRDLRELDFYRDTSPAVLAYFGGFPGDANSGIFILRSPIDGARCASWRQRAWDGTTSPSRARTAAPTGRKWSTSSGCSSEMTRRQCSCTFPRAITSASIPTACTCGVRIGVAIPMPPAEMVGVRKAVA